MSDTLKDALSSICNDRMALCFEPNCQGRIFAHDPSSRCCGHTYAEAVAHYKPIHAKMIQDEVNAIKDAHTKYAESTSGPSVGSSSSVNKPINYSVQTMFGHMNAQLPLNQVHLSYVTFQDASNAQLNIKPIFCTFDIFHLLISWLNLVARANIKLMS